MADVIQAEKVQVDEGMHLGFKVKHFPSKEDTGVDLPILKLAASVAGQIYSADEKEDFDLSTPELDVEVLLLDRHGENSIVTPDFAMVKTGQTLVLGWQGSTSTMDFIIDVALTPISNGRLSHVSKDLKIHAGFQSIIENDITNHDEAIVAAMKEHNITTLVTTGHSLGGALAQVAQVFIEAEMLKDGSIWKKYSDETPGFGTKAVCFSAPQSIAYNFALEKNAGNAKLNEFLKKIDENSCNVVYGTDVVPRGFSHLKFIDDSIKELIDDTSSSIKDQGFLQSFGAKLIGFADKVTTGYEEKLKKPQQELFKACGNYRHYGKIISYHDDSSPPMICRDYTNEEQKSKGLGRFGDIQWEETPDVVGKITHDHNFTVRGPGLAYNIPEGNGGLSSRLYYQHEVAILQDGKNDIGDVIPVDGWEDCLQKAKKYLDKASMGAVVEWENSGDKMFEGKGRMILKKDVPKSVDSAGKAESSWIFGKQTSTTFWRTPALSDVTDATKFALE